MASKPVSERSVVFLVGAVQFVNILDFMIVMPLGPDFATALGIPVAHLGVIGGSYTAAAAVSGVVSSLFLDRFDRRRALAGAMLGLVLATAAGGLAVGLYTLILARVMAGLFGGPATSLSLSIIADIIPPERRGKAMGAVMGAFAAASVLGVPAGLELARQGGWRLPFFAVAAGGVVVVALAIFFLPPLRQHLDSRGAQLPMPGYTALLRKSGVLLSFLMTATLMFAAFILIPNISAYVQHNLGYPRDRLGMLYMVGGVVSFATTRVAGYLVDRFSALWVGLAGSALFVAVVYTGFVDYQGIPVMMIFVGFMFCGGLRNVPYNTLTSKVPAPAERARFMSLQSTVQHLAAAAAAMLSSHLLHEDAAGRLAGIRLVAGISMVVGGSLPLLLWLVEKRVQPPQAQQHGIP